MTYSAPFYRCAFLFHMDGTDEVAETSLNVSSVLTGEPVPVGVADEVNAAMVSFLADIDSLCAAYQVYDGVKVTAIGTDGHAMSDPVIHPNAGITGGGAGGIIPQATIVLSLRSGETLGKGNYGRMYIPYSGLANSTSPYMSDTAKNTVLGSGADLIEDVNAAFESLSGGSRVRIISEARAAEGQPDRVVKQVAVGRVIDTQRRRRNRLSEEYAFAPVTGA